MKKSLLALAVSAAAFTGAASAAEIYSNDGGSVDFYGQLRTEMKFADADDYNADLSTGSSRIGVDAKYNVMEGFDVLGLVEVGVPSDSKGNNDVEVRRHLIGFATDFGTVQFGRDWTSSDDLGGTDYSYFFGGSGNLYDQLNGALSESQVKYSLDLDNWFVKATYGLNDSSNHQDLMEAFVGATYGDLSFHVGGGYNRVHEFETTFTDVNNNKTTVNGDISNTYYEATLVYNLLDNLQMSGTYYGSQLENTDNDVKIDQNALSLGAYWTFIEKTSLYAGYEYVHQKNDDSDASDHGNNAYLGLEYKFSSWARVFTEVGYSDGTTLGFTNNQTDVTVGPTTVDSETNFGIGARFYW
ncbi:porin [Vibrio sp. CK2-1]|uniref:porin n=1 Tax=Vibrio sp. CK2-1 TaxID=2912249 RepID=UPI001EFF84E0|nr:porin [Vibrio sp. CK2-1]MCF7354548.1 porin [Vibrio sp. CK2-1]